MAGMFLRPGVAVYACCFGKPQLKGSNKKKSINEVNNVDLASNGSFYFK